MKRVRDEEPSPSGAAPAVLQLEPINMIHYDETKPFPMAFDADFPAEDYQSRHGHVKTSIHWGQRKLLLSEIQLLTYYTQPGVSYHIVYAGSAPGTHLAFLDDMFKNLHTWELVDPGQFDRKVLGNRSNFRLRNQFFTNETAHEVVRDRLEKYPGLQRMYSATTVFEEKKQKRELQEKLQNQVGRLDVARGTHDIPSMYEEPITHPVGLQTLFRAAAEAKPTLFVSDIRSGSVSHSNFEHHVAENMKAQGCWTEIIQANASMLKFRLPYTARQNADGTCSTQEDLIDADGCVSYLGGDMLLPIWTRPTSTEGRLVVPAGAFKKRYNVKHYEDQCFYFNAKMRELVHFNHILSPDDELDNHYDSAAEVQCLADYVKRMNPHFPEAKAFPVAAVVSGVLQPTVPMSQCSLRFRTLVKTASKAITSHLRIKFRDAIERRDALILSMAKKGITAAQFYEDDAGNDEEFLNNSADAPHHVRGAGSGAPWYREALLLVGAAKKERARLAWWKNAPKAAAEGAPECKNCFQMAN